MSVISFFALLAFDIILSLAEVPKMMSNKLYKELITFAILLGVGNVLAAIKIFGAQIPNPSDFMSWIYSPISGLMKQLLQSGQ